MKRTTGIMNTHDVSGYLRNDDRCESRSRAVSSFFHHNEHECDGNQFLANKNVFPLGIENAMMKHVPNDDELYLRLKPFKNLIINEWIVNDNIPKPLTRQVKYHWTEMDVPFESFKIDEIEPYFDGIFDSYQKLQTDCDGKLCFCNIIEDIESISTPNVGLNYIPPCIERYKNLKMLDLENNKITKIGGLDAQENLESLYLNRNKISKIEGLENLINLTKLELGNNGKIILTPSTKFEITGGIKKIEGLDNLVNLEILVLQYNSINKIENLDRLKSLKRLNLDFNNISRINGLNSLRKLDDLSLSNNIISKIDGIDNLKRLDSLVLSGNKIPKIENLDKSRSIRHLFLDNNKIKKIEGLDNLNKLTSLELSNNEISKIEGLDNLNDLSQLYMDYNQIDEIESLDNNEKLRTLAIRYNNISKDGCKKINDEVNYNIIC